MKAGAIFRPLRGTIALMYHALGDSKGPHVDLHYRVQRSRFAEQLSLCIRLAGATLSAREWLGGRPGVIFTFDDGHDSDYHVAFPMLKQAGASADFFVNPAQVGTAGYATWPQLREMAESGMSIQSHGLDHNYFLTELSPHRLREDLRKARLEIEHHVGHPVMLLAPPGGRSPKGLERVAVECGYTHVLDSRPGRVRGDGARTLCRMAVTSQLELPTLHSWLRGGSALLAAQLRYSVLDFAKRLLGDETYKSVRGRLLGNAPN
jgi:peptidoglycan/xylan/chitin deacetylase (PgdA/CDA1 family)